MISSTSATACSGTRSPAAVRRRTRKMSSMRLAVLRLGLDLHLPGAAEQVEVVGVGAAHRGLQGDEDVADRDAERLGALAVELEVDLRRGGAVGREDAGSAGSCCAAAISPRATAARSAGEAPVRLCTWNSKPDALPRPMIGGRLKAKTLAGGDLGEGDVQFLQRGEDAERLGFLRSSNGFSAATTSARLGRARPSSRL